MLLFILFLLIFPLHGYILEEDHPCGTGTVKDLSYPSCAAVIKTRIPWDFGILEASKDIDFVTLRSSDPQNTYRLGTALGHIHTRYKKLALTMLALSARHGYQDIIEPYEGILKKHRTINIGIKNIHFVDHMRKSKDPSTLIKSLVAPTEELGNALNACILRTSGYVYLDEEHGEIVENDEFKPSFWSYLYWAFCYGTCRCCHRRR